MYRSVVIGSGPAMKAALLGVVAMGAETRRGSPGFGSISRNQVSAKACLRCFFMGVLSYGWTYQCLPGKSATIKYKQGIDRQRPSRPAGNSAHQSASGWTVEADEAIASAACRVNWRSQSWSNAGLVPDAFGMRMAWKSPASPTTRPTS